MKAIKWENENLKREFEVTRTKSEEIKNKMNSSRKITELLEKRQAREKCRDNWTVSIY